MNWSDTDANFDNDELSHLDRLDGEAAYKPNCTEISEDSREALGRSHDTAPPHNLDLKCQDEAVEFLDHRFIEDDELRLSGEQRLKLEIVRELRKPCDKKEYSEKLQEAARKIGKSTKTVRRLVKDWEQYGLAFLEPSPRSDKGKSRKSDFWYNFVVRDYKAGNKGQKSKTRAAVVETVISKVYELAKAEMKSEIAALEQRGLQGEDLDFEIGKLIVQKEKSSGFEFWKTKGKPPSRRTIERWLKPLEEKQYEAKTSRSPGWHGSKLTLKTRAGREIEVKHSNQVWQIDHTIADVLLVDEEGSQLGRPVLTTVIDCHSRCIMGFRVGFNAPSSEVVALALRHAILPKRYGAEYELRSKWDCYGVPKYLFTDGGKDFRSKHTIEWIADQLNFEPELRKRPSEGGIVERPFRTLSELLRQVGGYVGSNVSERPDDAEVRACLTLADLEWLLVGFFADNYNQQSVPVTRSNPFAPEQSRIERWHSGLHTTPVLYNERQLDICLMKATERSIYDGGHLNFANLRYKAENLGAYAGQKTILRYDPRDITIVFVYDRKDNREKFLARAYAIGLEAERLSIEEVKQAKKDAEARGKGINNISILEEASRRREFLKQKAKKTKAERRKEIQKKHDKTPTWIEQEKSTKTALAEVASTEAVDVETSSPATEVEYEPTDKVDYDLMREELGL